MKKCSVICAIFFMVLSFGQKSITSEDYPKGVYKTFEEFKGKKADDQMRLKLKESKNEWLVQFINEETDKKEKKAFAIETGDNLYVNLPQLIKTFPKEDRGQSGGSAKSFYLKTMKAGKYYYAQNTFTSSAAFGFGALGSALATRKKAIVYNTETQEYDLIRNSKEFTEFLEDNEPDLVEKYLEEKKKGGKEIDAIKRILFELESEG